MADPHETPSQGGSHPVHEEPSEVPGPGRTGMQAVVWVIAALVVLAVIAWFFVSAGG